MFESDSEYMWLLLIQTIVSQKLNRFTEEVFVLRGTMVYGVIWMTEQLSDDELSVVLSCMKWEGKISKRAKKMDDTLFEAVDEALKQIFKEEGAEVIYGFFENNCHLKREEIAEKPKVFFAGLERLLGSAAPMVEKMILRNLCRMLHLEYAEKEGLGFSECIRELKWRNRIC